MSPATMSNAQPIQSGKQLELRDVSGTLRVLCLAHDQRNWSRVGQATAVGEDGTERKVFIKQMCDRGGAWHRDHFEYECQGAAVATDLLGSVARVPQVLFRSDEHMLIAIEWAEVVPVDRVLRESDGAAFAAMFPEALRSLRAVLDTLFEAGDRRPELNRKQRSYESRGLAVNFKGIDIRNTGFGPRTNNREMVIFDFGKPYTAPIEEAAAKLLVSVGLLNWGRPTSRFLKGPDASLVEQAFEQWRPYTSSAAIEAELALQNRFRFQEFQGGSRLEAVLKSAGVRTLGARYMRRLGRLCRRLN
ncbi:MAG: hypothetical protein GY711_00585 [bacterium]|nr:hypothetical protein [bacterium]